MQVTRHLLVVCTANVCRSPVVERLLRRELDGAVDVDGESWVVSSAGTADIWPEMDRHTIAAAASAGIDLTGHERRTLTHDVIRTDGADLILTMTREHLRTVVALDPTAWPRTFTLLELARRAGASAPLSEGDGFAEWLKRVGASRRAADMMGPDPADDVPDPYGAPRRVHDAMLKDVSEAVSSLVGQDLWTSENPLPRP